MYQLYCYSSRDIDDFIQPPEYISCQAAELPFSKFGEVDRVFYGKHKCKRNIKKTRDISEFAQRGEILEPCQGRLHSMMGSLELSSTKEKL